VFGENGAVVLNPKTISGLMECYYAACPVSTEKKNRLCRSFPDDKPIVWAEFVLQLPVVLLGGGMWAV